MSPLGIAPSLEPGTADGVAGVATSVRANDVLVLRPTGGDVYLLTGGAGRGAQWAGAVEVHLAEEPVLREAARIGGPVRSNTPRPAQVVGPYHAAGAVTVPVLPGVFVVFGTTHGTFTDFADAVWVEAAEAVARTVDTVPAARLAEEEARAAAALAALAGGGGGQLDAVMQHVAATAAEALACDVGILYDRASGRVAVSDRGWPWPPHLGVGDIEDAMAGLWSHGLGELLCRQDLGAVPLPGPLGPTSRLVSALVLPVGDGALLALGHNESCPRGFTTACVDLAEDLAEAAASLLAASAPADVAEVVAEHAERTARLDPSTGLVNEIGWAELLEHTEHRRGTGGLVLVLRPVLLPGTTVDESAMAALGRVARQCLRQQDMVARVADDAIAVLVRDGGAALGETLVNRLQPSLSGHRAVVGWAARPSGGRLRDAYRAALQRADHRRVAALAMRRPQR